MLNVTKEMLEKINKHAVKELAEEEVYCFSVVLCDNEIDRDCEKFSQSALEKLAELYIGKTGIFNHDPKGENQTARIFDTRIERDESKKTADGEVYTCLKADAYMVKTDSNRDLIKEIEGGIKKEVSVGCAVAKEICSICGRDRRQSPCNHRKGQFYGAKKCCGVLSDPTDAYEWSFVAVPAQPKAGVTKQYGNFDGMPSEETGFAVSEKDYNAIVDDLRSDIIRFSYLEGDSIPVALTKSAIRRMDIGELVALKRELIKSADSVGESEISKAIEEGRKEAPSNKQFKL